MKKSFKLSVIALLIISCSSCASISGGKAVRYQKTKPDGGTPQRTLLNVMEGKIKGFNIGMWSTFNAPVAGLDGLRTAIPTSLARKMSYKIYNKEVHLVIDGIDVEQFYVPGMQTIPIPLTGDYIIDRNKAQITDRLEFIKTYLTGINEDDLKDIEVMPSSYRSDFDRRYNKGGMDNITNGFIFVKVTTVSGNGMLMKQQIGAVSRSQK